jgi:hypothetical protein
MKDCLGVVALLLAFGLPAFADSVSLIVAADPQTTLPGIPVILYLDVHNSGDAEFRLPGTYSTEVTGPGGNRFLLDVGTDSVTFSLPDHYSNQLTIPPRGHARFQIALAGQVTVGAFGGDARTWQPGTYSVRLVFVNRPSAELASQDRPPREFTSNPVSIVVEEPAGEEARTWQHILDATKGRGIGAHIRLSQRIGMELVSTTTPSNRYWPYIAMMATPSDQAGRLEHLVRLLAEIPADHAVYARVQFADAELRLRQALRAAGDDEPSDEVTVGIIEAYNDLVSIAATSPLDSTRADASTLLARVKNDHAIEALILEHKLPAVE